MPALMPASPRGNILILALSQALMLSTIVLSMALMRVDAAQAVGKVAVDVKALGADLLTLAGYKFYAPKGVGTLYVRVGVALEPIQYGAGHEHGLRPGTGLDPNAAWKSLTA